MRVSPGSTITAQCLTAAIDDETLGPWIDVRGCTDLAFYCSSTGTTTGGTVSFEEAAPLTFVGVTNPPVFGATTGAYSEITTKAANDFTGGKQVAVHISGAAYYFVRARISAAITGGGSVSVVLVAS